MSPISEQGTIIASTQSEFSFYDSRSLFINTALVLWAFIISQDAQCPIDTYAFTDTANVHPLPFSLHFEPRVKDMEAMLGAQAE